MNLKSYSSNSNLNSKIVSNEFTHRVPESPKGLVPQIRLNQIKDSLNKAPQITSARYSQGQ
jgi:hypothetical protein